MIYLSMFCFFFSFIFANPTDDHIVKDKVKVESISKRLKVEASEYYVIHWNDFSTNKKEVTRFIPINFQNIVIEEMGASNLNSVNSSALNLCDWEFVCEEKLFSNKDNNHSVIKIDDTSRGAIAAGPETPSAKGLNDFYRSTSESGQRWNFWNEAKVRKAYVLEYNKKTKTIRIINQNPFFPSYQEKGPLKTEAP